MAEASDTGEARTVVVTGLGIVSPIGSRLEDVWTALLEGRSGTGSISRFDPAGFETQIAAEVDDFDPRAYLGPKEARRADRVVQLAVAASVEALAHASLETGQIDRTRFGVLIGSALGGLETAERELAILQTRGPARVSPFFIPMFLADMAAGYVSIIVGAQGPNYATLSACASGAHAIGEAAAAISRGDADVMLAGGSEAAVTPGSVAGFNALGALSTRNDEAATASRPFDRTRDGFVVGEGAGMLVLESLAHARRRGARVLGVVAGYGATADASHMVQPAPDGDGAARAMTAALHRAGLAPSQIDYINAHGTSTPLNDRLETLALRSVFGRDMTVPVSSTKALTGHLLGAAGAVEAVISILALEAQMLPPTWHLVNPDPDCDLDYVAGKPRPATIQHVMSNSFGFGGHNVALVFSKAGDL